MFANIDKSFYKSPTKDFWKGRIDSQTDKSTFRFHQIVKICDLNKEFIAAQEGKLNLAIIGFTSDVGVRRNQGRPGAADGPYVIRKALAPLPVNFDMEINIVDFGNIIPAISNLEEAQNQLANLIYELHKSGYLTIVIGGGHEVAYPNHLGLYKVYNQGVTIVNFDAHFDIRPYEHTGSTSGTMFAQIYDLYKEQNLNFDYLVLGIQKLGNTKQLFDRAKDFGIFYLTAEQVENLLEFEKVYFRLKKSQMIHLTVCMDVFASCYAPGVSAPQPFGITPHKFLKYFKEAIPWQKVKSVDIAEVAPNLDIDNHTARLAANIIYYAIEQWTKSLQK